MARSGHGPDELERGGSVIVMARDLRWETLVAVVLLGPGCGSAVGSELNASCTTTSECASGATCVDGRCTREDASSFDVSTFDVADAVDAAETPCPSFTFPLTETQVTFSVPSGVRFMHVKAWGAGGNDEGQCGAGKLDGGLGGFTEAVFEVKAGDPLIVIVGKRGRAGIMGEERARFGFGDWGGGGLSGVFASSALITENDRSKALIIAGGGGGASAPECHPGGTGNHPMAGGMPTMSGGVGADDVNGGAGGYAGGKGGARRVGGLGGTGYVASSALDQRMLHVEPLAPLPPRADDPDYADKAGTPEMSGRIVIRFSCGRPELR